MFRLTRLPLRRCLHTAARAPRVSKFRAGVGATLVFGIAATAFAPTVLLDTPSEQKPVSEKTDTEGGESSSGGGGGGAYNPETGEINWDCPCLGGMAHGPCGEEFKAAFSCFVHSEDEPKGIDCVEKFQGMQNCFKEHPDIYAADLDDDDDEPAPAPEAAAGESEPVSSSSKQDAVAAPSPASEKAPTPKPRKAPAPEPSS